MATGVKSGFVREATLQMIGKKYGRITVLEVLPYKKLIGRCDCGTERVFSRLSIVIGHTLSCGCLNAERMKSRIVHSMCGTEEYKTWVRIKGRCTNLNDPSYHLYGGRGIRVCQEWMDSFQAFYDYMGDRPSNKHSIDRYPNNDGNYEPGNVRWATMAEQNRNRRCNRWLEHEGKRMVAADWANQFEIPQGTLTVMLRTRTIGECVEFFKMPKYHRRPVKDSTNKK